MMLSKAAKRVVAGIAAVVVLLCQSTALAGAGACVSGAANSATGAAQTPCHEPGGNNTQGSADDTHPAQCLSQATTSTPALPDIPLLAGMPALVLHATAFRIAEIGLPVSDLPPSLGEPPPLTILHCCWRN